VARIPQQLDQIVVDYLRSQIDTGDPIRTKKALQEVSRRYRQGYIIRPDQLYGFENAIIGLFSTQSDPKVRRWGINALAQIGRSSFCLDAIIHILMAHSGDLDSVAAGIAAVYKLSRNPSRVLASMSLDGQMVTLAALQHIPPSKLDLSSFPINIDIASPEILRLALVAVGLGKAPEPTFGNYTQQDIIKALGGHDDILVSQYAVGAITENPRFTVADLAFDIKDVEQKAANIRAWVFQLLAMRPDSAIEYQEYLTLGSRDDKVEPRIGLATGLRDTFYDGLEELVLEWVYSEADVEVRNLLIDHMIRQAARCPLYESHVLDFYQREPPGSLLQWRMEASAIGTPMWGAFKRIEQPDLLRRVTYVTNHNNTFNFNGNVLSPGAAFGGDVTNTEMKNQFGPAMSQALLSQISRARREVEGIIVDAEVEGTKAEALESLRAAQTEPTEGRLSKAVAALEKLQTAAAATLGAGTAIRGIVEGLRSAGLF
jgi:hypothetical protein